MARPARPARGRLRGQGEIAGKRLPGMVKDLQLVTIDGGPHGIAWTHSDQVNSALLKFMS